jgi:SPP1 family holin
MKISKGTIARTIMLAVVILNMILKHFNIDVINVSENEILSLIEALIEVAVIVVGFWKNNSYTQKAIKADEFLKTLRASE